ncbi:MAG TPA: imidazole glycerol phosphate synthase subunit HisH [Verrucomicrobia bacterium]|nr:MAG: imidazole glycerol phosphate synthase, glutamine amidotransferase subunit [Lentisphaerae bacterium GWF2_57_35]HBA82750.1 imidazole glycerol phosphate synthase subunit HisH [Verrucomicrobiota bacterium]
MIGIVDYGMGNLRSVFNALVFLGFEATVVHQPDGLEACDRLILPGVGAYAHAMQNLHAKGFIPVLQELSAQGRPLLGICLGMQMFSTTGSEPVLCQGLNLIAGEVIPMQARPEMPLPHVGWNTVRLRSAHPLFSGVREGDVYFVHSYCFHPAVEADILCVSEYGGEFISGVAHGNVVGLQFHPEKSQNVGMRILENFCLWDGTC